MGHHHFGLKINYENDVPLVGINLEFNYLSHTEGHFIITTCNYFLIIHFYFYEINRLVGVKH